MKADSLRPVPTSDGSVDELAAELLSTVFEADPLSGSLYGFPGLRRSAPRLRCRGRTATGAASSPPSPSAPRSRPEAASARRSCRRSTSCAAWAGHGRRRGRAPRRVHRLRHVRRTGRERPDHRFRSSSSTPRSGRRATWPACTGLPAVAPRRRSVTRGHAAGRTAVARLVESAMTQLDLLIWRIRPGRHRPARPRRRRLRRRRWPSPSTSIVRPALAAYREALRTDVLPGGP